MNLPNIHKTPVATLEAIEAYAKGEGSLRVIADTLHFEPHQFDKLMSWYLLHLREPFSDTLPSQKELLNLILLHQAEKLRQQNIKLTKEITAIHKKIKRLHTPVRE